MEAGTSIFFHLDLLISWHVIPGGHGKQVHLFGSRQFMFTHTAERRPRLIVAKTCPEFIK